MIERSDWIGILQREILCIKFLAENERNNAVFDVILIGRHIGDFLFSHLIRMTVHLDINDIKNDINIYCAFWKTILTCMKKKISITGYFGKPSLKLQVL